MKKIMAFITGLIILSCLPSEIYSQNSGQTLKLSKALKLVFESSRSSFSNLKGDHLEGSKFRSAILIEEGTDAIIDTADDASWTVNLGLFPDLDKARDRMDKFNEEFAADSIQLAYYKIKQFDFPNDIHYGAYQVIPGKVSYYRITFKLVYDPKGYRLELEVKAAPYHQPLVLEFYQVGTEKVDNAFSQSLFALMKEADTNFMNIRGELLETGFQNKYASKLQLESAFQSFIVEFLTSNTFYGFMGTVKESDIGQAMDIICGQVAQALGKDYWWCFYPDDRYIGFTHSSKVDLLKNDAVRVFNMSRPDGTIDIVIRVERNYETGY